jgi:predicted site-specific integrase-resolvase
MPIMINGQTYYRTAEVCRIIRLSKATFFRWCREGIFEDAKYRDRRGWRLFTIEEVEKFKEEANRVIENDQLTTAKVVNLMRQFA